MLLTYLCRRLVARRMPQVWGRPSSVAIAPGPSRTRACAPCAHSLPSAHSLRRKRRRHFLQWRQGTPRQEHGKFLPAQVSLHSLTSLTPQGGTCVQLQMCNSLNSAVFYLDAGILISSMRRTTVIAPQLFISIPRQARCNFCITPLCIDNRYRHRAAADAGIIQPR